VAKPKRSCSPLTGTEYWSSQLIDRQLFTGSPEHAARQSVGVSLNTRLSLQHLVHAVENKALESVFIL
jgi:hypothetical protein